MVSCISRDVLFRLVRLPFFASRSDIRRLDGGFIFAEVCIFMIIIYGLLHYLGKWAKDLQIQIQISDVLPKVNVANPSQNSILKLSSSLVLDTMIL